MAINLSEKRVDPAAVVIPDRLYFKIGDVATLCGLETYVLRFWESQFPQLKPNKSGTGQRLYRKREVELVLEIKRLVHGEGYTLAGARQALEGIKRREQPRPAERAPEPEALAAAHPPADTSALLRSVRAELREIATLLGSPDPAPVPRRRQRSASMQTDTDSLFPS